MHNLNMHRLIKLAQLGLVVLIAIIVVGLIIEIGDLQSAGLPESSGANENPYINNDQTELLKPPVDYSIIVENDIFNRAGGSNYSRNMSTAPLVNGGDLGLELLGTTSGSNNAVSRAIIRDTKTNTTNPYRIGQTVTGVKILAIDEDSVTLLHNGMRKVLKINNSSANTQQQSYQGLNSADNSSEQKISSVAEIPQKALQKISRIESLFREATIEPYMVGDNVEGLEINNLKDVPMAEMIGLKNGDVVKMFNGQLLTSKQKAFQVLQKARSSPAINIELLRDGIIKEISFDLR